jgi:hypothetical protein
MLNKCADCGSTESLEVQDSMVWTIKKNGDWQCNACWEKEHDLLPSGLHKDYEEIDACVSREACDCKTCPFDAAQKAEEKHGEFGCDPDQFYLKMTPKELAAYNNRGYTGHIGYDDNFACDCGGKNCVICGPEKKPDIRIMNWFLERFNLA